MTYRVGRTGIAQALRRLTPERGGAAAVEFAIVAPVLLVLVLGIMEGGRALWTQNALNFAVDQAARCASIDTNNCGTSTQIQNYAAAVSGEGFTAATFTVSTAACGNVVSASFPIRLYIPFVGSALTLTAQSCYP
jgi:Flp pilus assembly protein TadG